MKTNALRRRIFRIVLSTAMSCAVSAGTAYATPSTQIWIPSTDIQPYKTVHLNIDSYVRTKPEGSDPNRQTSVPVSYTHLRAHETRHDLVCRLLLEKKKDKQ